MWKFSNDFKLVLLKNLIIAECTWIFNENIDWDYLDMVLVDHIWFDKLEALDWGSLSDRLMISQYHDDRFSILLWIMDLYEIKILNEDRWNL